MAALVRVEPVPWLHMSRDNPKGAHHVVFAKAVFVPAGDLKKHVLEAMNAKLHGLVPFWVERFGDGDGRVASIA